MNSAERPGSLRSLAERWQRASGRASRWAFAGLMLLTLVVGAIVARFGTWPTRMAAWATLGVAAGLLLWHRARERRLLVVPRQAIQRVIAPADAELAERALRAVELVEGADRGTLHGAPELARVHYQRLLERAPVEAVEAAAHERAKRFRLAWWLLAGVAVSVVLVEPSRVAEGFNVLFAYRGRAPIDWEWLDRERIVASPPSYLRQLPGALGFSTLAVLPEGTDITIRGRPVLADRRLVLRDDRSEIEFTDDGRGGVVAHYTVEGSTALRVGSRYGEVVILEPRELEIHAVPDATPIVELSQAPRTVKLAEIDRLELNWAARDDHGLKQVDLVLRSGEREERRPLAQYSGETRAERGAYTLLPHDPFLRHVFLPVTVHVEARDMSNLPSASSGLSAAVTIEVPAVGEVEARRMEMLGEAKRALIDLFVWHERNSASLEHETRSDRLKRLRERDKRVARVVTLTERALSGPYAAGGLRSFKSFVKGQLDLLSRPLPHSDTKTQTGAVLLAFDAAFGSLGDRDAQSVAKALADVAEQAARSAKLARETEQRARHLDDLGEALDAFTRGTEQLIELGELGRDLGSVARAGFRRISRARESEDLFHTELAALHLAARLRRPTPSYSSAGGHQGVESGANGQRSSLPEGPASEADRAFEQMMQALEQLAQDHRASMDRVNQILEQARSDLDTGELGEEARGRAQALRDVAEGLPSPGGTPGSAQAEAALGREHLQGMAHALENLDFEQAVESGKRAEQVLREARRKAEGSGLGEAIHQAEMELAAELNWAEAKLAELRHQADERARGSLAESSAVESELAQRTERIVQQGRGAGAALPRQIEGELEQAKRLMEEAAQAMSSGDGTRARLLQAEAQRHLEQPDQGESSGPDNEGSASPGDESGGRTTQHGGDVPDPEPANGPAEFRKRVLEGLAPGRSGRLGAAVQRYVEGLLQ